MILLSTDKIKLIIRIQIFKALDYFSIFTQYYNMLSISHQFSMAIYLNW